MRAGPSASTLIRVAAQDSDDQVATTLIAKLDELGQADPLSALDLEPGASQDQLRQRFLALTKIWHPSKYARRSIKVRRLATEVFLMLRKAYERGQASAGQTSAGQTSGQTSPPAWRDRTPRVVGGVSARLAEARRRVRASERSESHAFDNARTTKMPVFRRDSPATPASTSEQFRAAVRDLAEGHLERAQKALSKLIEIHGIRSDWQMYLHYANGRCAQASGRQQQARESYRMALALDPSFEPARRSLAILDEYTR